ncbi:SPW repeat domain-containing protein [Neorhodopirellula pilleata]|uniref:SPW repeat-containing integral membrane domain-containing protein n=1 Tax=Neorhodopirellula pilleata TaxID=2714738 RepID=A0A5C6AMW6_9BACT|nr:SPW repeat protein [Neorhodopirellula pilleata]TWU01393.1 hypothetical protein Pla100_11200 [Neorhodopirellula pilleata]
MWGRVVEIMTAVWLAVSPFVFRVQSDATILWGDQIIALTICVLAGLSYWRPTRHAHLLILVIAVGLIAWGRLAGTPPPFVHQNHIVVGLFLLMIAIIPNHASYPPPVWQNESSS